MTLTPMASEHEASSYDAEKDHLTQARIVFGKRLARWRRLNRWSQETAEHWATSAGFVPIFNSQWSKLERGLTPQPGPLIFRGLGILNTKIADKDWGRGLSRSLLDRLEESKPVVGDDGEPWVGHDFYAAFIGELEWPTGPGLMRRLTPVEADAWNVQIHEWIDQISRGAGLNPLEALSSLMSVVPDEAQVTMQRLAMGKEGFSAAQLERVSDMEGLGPEKWLKAWQQKVGHNETLELGRHWRFVQTPEEDTEP